MRFDCAMFWEPQLAGEVVGKGTFFWQGAADTWFWVDPTNDLIFVGMTQQCLAPGGRQGSVEPTRDVSSAGEAEEVRPLLFHSILKNLRSP
jgi:CubicO group peptidase (beta-lactamase class C family)